jgi:hypothetical protein
MNNSELFQCVNIRMVTKLRKIKWAGYIARTLATNNLYKILVGSMKGRTELDDSDIDKMLLNES